MLDTDRDTTATDTAIMVTTEEAAKMAGVSARTIRRWINRGVLPSIDGPDGRMVSPADLARARTDARSTRGHGQETSGQRSHPDMDTATRGHDRGQDWVSVPARARQELEAVRDEWLMPLVDRIAELERENGRLEAERDQLQQERDELRARLKPIEATQSAETAAKVESVEEQQNEAQAGTQRPWWQFWRRQ